MFNVKDYYEKKKMLDLQDYRKSLDRISEIKEELKKNKKQEVNNFFLKLFEQQFFLTELETELCPDYFLKNDFNFLRNKNLELHKEIFPQNYSESYSNPEFSVKKLGSDFGSFFSFLYSFYYNQIEAFYKHQTYTIFNINQILCDLYEAWLRDKNNCSNLIEMFKNFLLKTFFQENKIRTEQRFDPDFKFYTDWIDKADFSDLRYLFYYGIYIDKSDLELAKFLSSLPQGKIDQVMENSVKSYIHSFAESRKSYQNKSTVIISFRAGMERMVKSLIKHFENYNLHGLVGSVQSSGFRKQFDYDHRFGNALFLDEKYVESILKDLEKSFDSCSDMIRLCSGNFLFNAFGEKPFKPVNKKESLKYTKSQLILNQEFNNKKAILFNRYYKRDETSFSIIGFPTPEIGSQFPEIFDDIIKINMLSHTDWLKIQQPMIDVLDKAEYVHIKGVLGNKTDIKVKMPELENPDTQSNFFNCGATLNIPVGEIFTTPQLKGTSGVLHIGETFLKGLFYKDLYLEFEDGNITKYSCKNFENEEECKKYIEENLIFPHKSLPLGEFAIGTNTLAYKIAKKYDIMRVLPILIIEKMGPHFAIGDTCYSWREEQPIFNPDGKEITARDNERSILRKKDIQKAYTQCHTDITLPYEEIDFIRAVFKDGSSSDIIYKGLFSLEGTEILNNYFEK